MIKKLTDGQMKLVDNSSQSFQKALLARKVNEVIQNINESVGGDYITAVTERIPDPGTSPGFFFNGTARSGKKVRFKFSMDGDMWKNIPDPNSCTAADATIGTILATLQDASNNYIIAETNDEGVFQCSVYRGAGSGGFAYSACFKIRPIPGGGILDGDLFSYVFEGRS